MDSARGTYVACLDCGKQFAYDWERMRIGEPLDLSSSSQDFQDF